ncbi:MAG: right-handed parallel beta-helix repeat-containing protein, partial [Clostridia bacterium]|nr:right-handed parallel beta-helix repeat-containing protein [Clostridia bacterium]
DIVPTSSEWTENWGNYWDKLASMEMRTNVGGTYYYDDFLMAGSLEPRKDPTAPTVVSVTVEGVTMVGKTLTANAQITDDDSDELDVPLYQWQVSENGTEWNDLTGATGKTYQLTSAEVGKLVRVVVTPRSKADPKVGEPKASDATQAISDVAVPPSAKDAAISGKAETGSMVTATYTYLPSSSQVEEGKSTIIWETADQETGPYTTVQSSVSKEYTLKSADGEKYLRVRIIPKDKNGLAGTEIISATVKVTVWTPPESEQVYYVATDGNDENAGTIDAPFATIEKARDVIAAASLPEGGVTVYIRGGTYPVSKTINFTSQNSGEEGKPIVYQAYPGEEVAFVGGKTLDTSKMQKVTDEALLNRLVDKNAREHLMSIDLGEQGVEMTPLAGYGWGFPSYNPTEIYMNGTQLKQARWPNDDQSLNLIQAAPVVGEDAEGYNDRSQPVKMTYPDEENRSAKWTVKKGDAYVGGAIVYFWANTNLRIDTLDAANKTVTSIDPSVYSLIPGAGWGQQYKIYFGNIFEEIDQPGESYVDRENNILYFYPVGDTKKSNIMVSTLNRAMVNVSSASYLTFKGISFEDTRATPVTLNGANHIQIEDTEISGSSQMGITITNSKNCTISGCHFYDMASSAISITGGDRTNLNSDYNVIENSYFHNCSLKPGERFAIILSGTVGETIRHNEFDDLQCCAISLNDANDTLIEYNKISNSLYFSSDMGAIYWGRNNTVLGTVVRYNYFENLGSELKVLKEGYVDGVFWDDGASGPELYGNVFYNAGNEQSSIRTNGGEVSNVHGNVIIDDTGRTDYSIYLWGWGTRRYTYNGKAMNPYIPACNWLYLMDMRSLLGTAEGSTNRKEGNSSLWSTTRQDLLWSSTWKEHYQGTLWSRTLDLYSKELYEGAKVYFDAGDEYGLLKFMDENVPAGLNNKIHDNVLIGSTAVTGKARYEADDYDNYKQDNIKEAASLFADYGSDFTLTTAGLKTVQQSAPKFENIPFDQIGLLTQVGGHKPAVTIKPEIFAGIAAAGNEISPSYVFDDEDGDLEGTTQVYWYVSDEKDGTYTMVEGKQGQYLQLTADDAGRFYRYKVIPYDTNSMRGASVMSDPIAVRQASSVDYSALSSALKEARGALENAVIGNETGQYPQTAADELSAAIEAAQKTANKEGASQHAVNAATEQLEEAIAKFYKQKIAAIDRDKIGHSNINELLKDTENWDNPGGCMKFENGSLVIDAAEFDLATYKGETYLNQEISFRLKLEKKEETGWAGIYFRQSATDQKVWLAGNRGFMFDVKGDIMNLQEYGENTAAGIIDTVDNSFIEFGKEYVVTLGIYDTEEENKVYWEMKVDGETVYSKITDCAGLYGKEGYFSFSAGKAILTISPTQADKTNLSACLTEAAELAGLVVAGNEYGQYPAEKMEAFNKAVTAAKAAMQEENATQYTVDKAAEELAEAMRALRRSVNLSETVSGDKTITIRNDLPSAAINVEKTANEVKLVTEKDTALPAISISAERSIGTVSVTIPEDTALSGAGTLLAVKELTAPSVSVNGTNMFTIQMAEGILTSDHAIRILFPGQGKKQVGIITNGKFTRISKKVTEDSQQTADKELA